MVMSECLIFSALLFNLFFFQQISYYEVSPNYEVIIFATDVTKIVNVNDFKRGKVKLADILKILDDYNYDGEF